MQVEKKAVAHSNQLIETLVRQCNELVEIESLEKEIESREQEEVK